MPSRGFVLGLYEADGAPGAYDQMSMKIAGVALYRNLVQRTFLLTIGFVARIIKR